MAIPLIQFPLSLRPVVRSRERGAAEGASMPYHPAYGSLTERDVIDDRALEH